MQQTDDLPLGRDVLRAEELKITTKEGQAYQVTEEGSLSLLALGYKGLMAWRAKRMAAAREREAGKEEGS